MNKRGTILIENVVFIILNVVFLSIIILFLTRQASSGHVLEENYAKNIALLADYAKPEMIIRIDMEKGMNIAEENGIDFSKVVKIDGNVVSVKLTDDGGYSYSFFNDVELHSYPSNDDKGLYILTVSEKLEVNE
jgi:uncharacterized protein (UPF0333 family)